MRAGAAGSGCMVPLNLLPHREAARKFHRRRWHAMLGAALVVAMLTGGLLHLQAQQRISREEQATQVLEAALAQQGPKAAEVQKLEAALRQGVSACSSGRPGSRRHKPPCACWRWSCVNCRQAVACRGWNWSRGNCWCRALCHRVKRPRLCARGLMAPV